MGSSLFRVVIQVSLQMALPLFLVFLCTTILRNYIRAATFLTIKKILLIGLLIAMVSAYWGPLIQIKSLSNNIPLPDLPAVLSGQIFEKEIILSGNNTANSVIPNRDAVFLIFEGIWFCGMVLYAYQMVQRNIQLIYSVQHIPTCDQTNIRDLCNKLCQEIGLKKPPVLAFSSEVISPKTVGWIRPVIVLPDHDLSLSDDKFRLLLLHELYHFKGQDNGWKLLSSIVFSIYWFHPLVRWLVSSFAVECELACDEKVLKGATASITREYAEMLILFSSRKGPPASHSTLQSGLKSDFFAAKLRMEQVFLLESKRLGYSFLLVCICFLSLFSGVIGAPKSALLSAPVKSILDSPQQVYANLSPYTSEQQMFCIPISPSKLVNRKNINKSGKTYRSIFYFLATEENKTVVSVCNGVVVETQLKERGDLNEAELKLSPLGKYIIVDCGNGLLVRYTFLDSILVQPGQTVAVGDVLGTAGHTGSSYGNTDQCGLSILQDGVMIDPLPFFALDIPIEEIP